MSGRARLMNAYRSTKSNWRHSTAAARRRDNNLKTVGFSLLVKGQTPKVEAQEDKKKLPRGRAKKRLQYNRRYVNVVTGMGGKRVGPNSNADKMK
ncbi:40S ribosomal protein S30 [Seminavis robusta]|uniref:40S ribosomal protein S30 n=1 Tax=Seminavis robusta TaxID=568900 RepID=A0A9N8HRP1_9STRA|nr:40S ribosomal protein S30 [Seminavis robusta]|eukprot:Sro1093_g240360.1 40S ribosomal protein S30 (95) ;mRNA; r:8786-9449